MSKKLSDSSGAGSSNSPLEEVSSKRPLSKLEVMPREMERAIASELYERAAELRDAIKQLKTHSHSS